MANLVDDYKNMIPYEVPNGIRIRDGIVTVSVSNDYNGIAPLDIWEGALCYSNDVTMDDPPRLFFKSNVTANFITFKIPTGTAESNGTDFTDSSPCPANFNNLVNQSYLKLSPYTFGMDRSSFIYSIMYWLVLRIG